MSHYTAKRGTQSHLRAAAALLANGLEVLEPLVDEPYDLATRDPKTGEFKRYQVKTARVREDRGGAIVVYARKHRGEPYTKEDADYIIGVHGKDVYLIENTGIGEYWATPKNIREKWKLLSSELA